MGENEMSEDWERCRTYLENRYKWLQEEIPAKQGRGVGNVLRSIWFKTGMYFEEQL